MATLGLNLREGHDTVRDSSERSVLARLREGIASIVKRAQYAQMVRALNSLPDDVLRQIGLQRSEIPARAHWLVYDGD